MGLFDLFSRAKLEPAWQYSTAGVIWRLHPTRYGKLVGEERDVETKTTSFFCVDCANGNVLWANRTFDEQWWIGIETVHKDVLLLHGYLTPDLPEKRGLTAVDLESGQQLWSNRELAFVNAYEGLLLVQNKTRPSADYLEVDRRTGWVIGNHGQDSHSIMKIISDSEGLEAGQIKFPVPLDEVRGISPDTASVVARHCKTGAAVGPVEVVDDGIMAVFSLHERISGGDQEPLRANNIIGVVDKQKGRLLFKDILNQNVTGVVPDSFFVQHRMVFFVKERKTLTALPLGEM